MSVLLIIVQNIACYIARNNPISFNIVQNIVHDIVHGIARYCT